MEALCYEIMKNSSETLVEPNIPIGRKIDSKRLLKSIAPTGYIYIRLLAELPDESDDMLHYSIFNIPENQTETSSVKGKVCTRANCGPSGRSLSRLV